MPEMDHRYRLEFNRAVMSTAKLAAKIEKEVGCFADVDPHQPTTILISNHEEVGLKVMETVDYYLDPKLGGARMSASHTGVEYAISKRVNSCRIEIIHPWLRKDYVPE